MSRRRRAVEPGRPSAGWRPSSAEATGNNNNKNKFNNYDVDSCGKTLVEAESNSSDEVTK